MKIGIMQPTYLPWCGYFALIDHVDYFVFLDDVQFSKRSWQQRNKIAFNGESKWLTVPVLTKNQRLQLINEVKIDPEQDFQIKHHAIIEQAYRGAPQYSQVKSTVSRLFDTSEQNLSSLNIKIIKGLCQYLSIDKDFLRSSEIPCFGSKTEKLLKIVRYLGGGEYIAVPGSREYIEESRIFIDAGIPVHYFEYIHPIYQQNTDEFISHLSVLDLIFNSGFCDAKKIIQSGVQRFGI